MPREHAPNIKTQVGLMQLRKNAERNEIERRSQMNESVDIGHRVLAEIQGDNTPEARELAHAKETIFRLLHQSAAFSRTIQHLTQAWGPSDEAQAQEEVDKLVDHFAEEVEQDPSFAQTARQWTEQQVTHGPTQSRAKIRRKPR
jgi:hypothetical protein